MKPILKIITVLCTGTCDKYIVYTSIALQTETVLTAFRYAAKEHYYNSILIIYCIV